MNITHVDNPEFPEKLLVAIFNRQHQLSEKYVDVERKNGTGYGILAGSDFNINTHRGQALVKDMVWRVVEELTEATEAYEKDKKFSEHMLEEVIDAFHFMVELLLTTGFRASDYSGLRNLMTYAMVDQDTTLVDQIYPIIQHLGNACNKLKLKPWKQSAVLTDTNAFEEQLDKAFMSMIQLFKYLGMDAEDVFNIYYRKSEVNKFRIRSNY